MRAMKQRFTELFKERRMRRHAAGAVALVAVLTTCEASRLTPQQLGSANPATPGGTVRLALDAEVGNPHLATVQGNGLIARLYGNKGPGGEPAHVDTVVAQDVAQQLTITAILDGEARVTSLADSLGRRLDVLYGTTHATLRLQTPEGRVRTEVVPLASVPGLPTLSPEPATASQGNALVTVHVRLLGDGKPLQELENAQVLVTLDGEPEPQLAHFQPGSRAYVLALDLRETARDIDRATCIRGFADLHHAVSRSGMALDALARGTPGQALTPIGQVLQAWNATFQELGIGPHATLKAGNCVPLHLPASPRAGKLTVAVTHPWLGTRTVAVPYDLDSTADLLASPTGVDLNVDFETPARILQVATEPSAPQPGEPFRLRFDLTHPGASVAWNLTGSDGYRQSGTAASGPGEMTARSEPIPGTAKGALNTVEAELRQGGRPMSTLRWDMLVR
jgi:hypothetical protein